MHRAIYSRAWTAAVIAVALSYVSAAAQIVTDGSVGAAQSLSGPAFSIGSALGTLSGSNLFHSFSTFNLATGESATFIGPSSLMNIVGRVTGGASSSIDGTIATLTGGSPNLFLVNPAGVIFGPNASLNVEGSFHVSTADYLKFADGAKFMSNLGNGSSFTTAAPAAFGFLTANPAGLVITGSLLNVGLGSTMSIVGGEVQIVGGALTAPSGTIAATAIASSGEVPLDPTLSDGTTVAAFGTASIIAGSLLDATDYTALAPTGGSIYVRAGTLTIDSSTIVADNSGAGPAGTIVLAGEDQLTMTNGANVKSYATGESSAASIRLTGGDITVNQGSQVYTDTFGSGHGGDVTVNADSLTIAAIGSISTGTYGSGQGGDITVDAGSITLVDGGSIASSTTGFILDGSGAGDAGQVTVNADRITIADEGTIASWVFGSGNGGNIAVHATEALEIFGDPPAPNPTGILAISLGFGLGDPDLLSGDTGSIVIDAGNFTITPGGVVTTSANGSSKGGDIAVNVAGALTLLGGGIDATSTAGGGQIAVSAESIMLVDGRITSEAGGGYDNGVGGNIAVTATGTLTITGDQGGISANAHGTDAGHISIEANSIALTDGARISTEASGDGDGGNIVVHATQTLEIHGSPNVEALTGIFADNVGITSSGDAGGITIYAGSVTVDGTGQITNSTVGSGNGGDVVVNADSVTLTSGGSISSETRGEGSGGSVKINAAGALAITGGSISAESEYNATGDAGGVSVYAGSVTIHDGGISTGTHGLGNAGAVTVDVAETLELAGFSRIGASTDAEGDAGTVTVTADTITLADGGQISSTTSGPGNGGNIVVHATGILEIHGDPNPLWWEPQSGIIADSSFLYGGPGGLVENTSIGLAGADSETEDSPIAGNAGKITVQAGSITIDNSGLISSSTDFDGNGGDIWIEAERITLADGGSIASQTLSTGDGGNIVVHARESLDIHLAGISASQSLLFGGEGDAGSITIEAGSVTISESGELSSSTFGSGNAGNITVNASQISLSGALITTATYADGNGGNIEINAKGSLLVTGSSIVASAEFFGDEILAPPGDAGQITISANDITLSDGGAISAEGVGQSAGSIVIRATQELEIHGNPNLLIEIPGATSKFLVPTGILANSSDFDAPGGTAGTITVDAGSITIDGTGRISSDTLGYGKGGDITVNVTGALEITGDPTSEFFTGISASTSFTNSDSGDAGHVTVNAGNVVLTDSGQISSSTSGSGDGGDVIVGVAGALEIHGNPNSLNLTSIIADSLPGATGDAGTVNVTAGSVTIDQTGAISGATFGSGKGGDVTVNVAGALLITGGPAAEGALTGISANADAEPGTVGGDAGHVTVNAGSLTIEATGSIVSGTFGSGEGGDVTVNVSSALTITGDPESQLLTGIGAGTVSSADGGDAGQISVNAGSITLADGGQIESATSGSGDGGNVSVEAAGAIEIRGNANPFGQITAIAASSLPGATGDAGQITVTADSITLTDGAQIATNSSGPGIAGDILIKAQQVIVDNSTISSDSAGTGSSGSVVIDPTSILITNGSEVSAKATSGGASGDVVLSADLITINNSVVSTQSESGGGGNIQITASRLLYIVQGEVSATIFNGDLNAGNVTIYADLLVLDQSVLSANAFEGTGGNLHVKVNGLIATPDSIISASSERGVNGLVDVSALSSDVTSGLVELSGALVEDASRLACTSAPRGTQNQFSSVIVHGRGDYDFDPDAPGSASLSTALASQDRAPSRTSDLGRNAILSGCDR